MKPIFLCGFMGCGKTTVGKRLATVLGAGYCDMDQLIVKREEMTIPEIFEKYGEEHFRKLETELIEELSESYKGVISCGGGAMLRCENAELAKKRGMILFLDTPFRQCYYRISGDKNRPIAANSTKSELEELYNKRYPIYKGHSSYTIPCMGSPNRIVTEIVDTLKLHGEL